ncbi:hypothetical protein [Acuticoccus yangtzensis]|uniref:hypothetical protein n=1 Tax=Acuticoccus yangtzensis TaxID=1443441 RepID=UPI0009499DD9|nr:hypothetical protein [Acuticoccus yangtzensis]ORE96340.1 hypothetical protein ATO13_05740 [Stappia sp. 22II-S9-Z10]
MIKGLMGAALALTVVVGGVSDADAFTRKRVTTGPYGATASFSASTGCVGNTCSRTATRTGPYGNSLHRSSSATCAGGACTISGSTSGPYRGVSRSTTITR